MTETKEGQNFFDKEFITLREFISYEKDLIVVAAALITLSFYFSNLGEGNSQFIAQTISFVSFGLALLLWITIYFEYQIYLSPRYYDDKGNLVFRERPKCDVFTNLFNLGFSVLIIANAMYLYFRFIDGNRLLNELIQKFLELGWYTILFIIALRILAELRNRRVF